MQILEEQRAAGRKRRAITTAAISATTPFTELRNGIKRAKMVSTVASQDTTAAAVAPVSTVPELETTAFSVVLRGGMFEGKPPRGDYKYVAAWANLLRWVRGYMTGAFAMEVRYRALTRDAETLMVLGVKKEGDEVRDPVYNQSSYNAALQSAVGLRRKDAVLVFVQIWVIPEREVEVGEEA